MHRILAKVHERGRITDDEYEPWVDADRSSSIASEATFTEKQCLEWVKSMAPPSPSPRRRPSSTRADGGRDGNGWSQKKLRRLFSTPSRTTRPRRRAKSIVARTH